jgi:hypothetical protein
LDVLKDYALLSLPPGKWIWVIGYDFEIVYWKIVVCFVVHLLTI